MKYPFFFLFLVMSFTLSCGQVERVFLSPILKDQLEAEYKDKLEELRRLSEGHIAGWPSDEDCDGALWAGVARAAGADWVDVSAALRPNGRPTRRPNRDCMYPEESKTTTSNDMITGIILGLLSARDVTSLHRLWQYGDENNWIMGYPRDYVSRVLLRPNGITLLARALFHLSGGKRDYAARLAPMLYGPVQKDYEGHLLYLSRYMEQQIGGFQYGMEVAETIAAFRNTDDALAQAVAGHYNLAAILLLNDYKTPSYVRGHDSYKLVHWLFAARIILDA